MQRSFTFILIIFSALIGLTSCSRNEPLSSKAVIEESQKFSSVKDKIEFLTAKAQHLITKDDLRGAQEIGEYILERLDAGSVEARSILETVSGQQQVSPTGEDSMGQPANI